MSKIIFMFCLLCCAAFCAAQDFDGYTINEIHITTTRMRADVLRNKFKLKPGDTFTAAAYEDAQQALHDMRLCKELNFTVTPRPDNKVDINIDSKDGYFFFPLFFVSGGGSNAVSVSVAEGNFFKQGETAYATTAFSRDGGMGGLGVAVGNSSYNLRFSRLDIEQRFYPGGWSSNYGIFSTAADENRFGTPLEQIDTKKTDFTFAYSYKIDRLTLSVEPELQDISFKTAAPELDPGNHNKITVGANYAKNMPQGVNMGAVFGYGLTDKKRALRPLTVDKLGYNFGASYTGGGGWTGADYDINKFSAGASFLTEFKQHNVFLVSLRAQQSVNAVFSEQVRSVDLLDRNGRYDRQILGDRGIGLSASYTYYLSRGDTGLLAVEPFYQLAYVDQDGYKDHSGIGASLFYKFWRFPFPLGLNYTHNLSDGSDKVAFYAGIM
ncbi:MAG: hypothetical protein FWF35_00530 [Elusimicrobia bacterium]|nr:hypothetical protein [Elusimicrobiota bacterium]